MEAGHSDAVKDKVNPYNWQQESENEIYASWFDLIISNHE